MKNLKFKWECFLVGFPYGLRGLIEINGRPTAWDRLRYRLLTGEWME